jgi:hypothetical protein
MRVARLGYSSTLKMETVRSFETLLNFYGNALRRIPEDGLLNEVVSFFLFETVVGQFGV